jgi:hypothetical protein
MGKKKPEEMAKERVKFVAGAEQNGIRERLANEIFDTDGEVRRLRLQQVARRRLLRWSPTTRAG